MKLRNIKDCGKIEIGFYWALMDDDVLRVIKTQSWGGNGSGNVFSSNENSDLMPIERIKLIGNKIETPEVEKE